MDYYKGDIPILDDSTFPEVYMDPVIDGIRMSRGYVPRDYSQYPEEMFTHPSEMDLIPESEWDARYDEEERTQSSLEHLYLRGGQPAFINLDQNGHGYCWSYSIGTCIMMTRLRMNQPLVRLNPHSVAAIIKKGADQGGWCGLAADFARRIGMTEEGTGPGQWPLHSRNLSNDTAACREMMGKYRLTEDWVDLTRQVYDQNLTRQQLATRLQQKDPCAVDYDEWAHSICAIRWVRVERGRWAPLILNSWKGWGRFGLAVINTSWTVDGSIGVSSVVA